MRTEGRVVMERAILWRRLDEPGHDAAHLLLRDSCWHLTGTAVFSHDRLPCRLDYLVICNLEWQTLSTKVMGWVGSTIVEIELRVDSDRLKRSMQAFFCDGKKARSCFPQFGQRFGRANATRMDYR
jgi:hypothetical protein